jgi:hypothetical protein
VSEHGPDANVSKAAGNAMIPRVRHQQLWPVELYIVGEKPKRGMVPPQREDLVTRRIEGIMSGAQQRQHHLL